MNPERFPPNSLESEASLLGSMLLEPDCIPIAADLVSEEDFFRSDHRAIFAVLVGMHAAGKPVDLVLAPEVFRKAGKLEDIGGTDYLAKLVEWVPSAANVEHYAQVVAELAAFRRVIAECDRTMAAAYRAGPGEADEILDAAEKRLLAATQGLTRKSEIVLLGKAAKAELAKVGERIAGRGSQPVRTGIPILDGLNGGFHGGELVIVAARPGQGKSALLLNIAEFAAARQRLAVGVFSLEMRAGSLGLRSVCADAAVNGVRLRNGNVSADELAAMGEWADRLEGLPIYADDTRDNSLGGIRRTARRMVSRFGCRAILIDYLQLVQIPNLSKQGKYERVSAVSNGLKSLALELDVPVIAAAQINRESEKGRRKPELSDLRDSGDIEQDADAVLFLWQPLDDDAHRNERELYQAKGRSTGTGNFHLDWNPIKTRFLQRGERDWRDCNVEEQQAGLAGGDANEPEPEAGF